jgi:hypothetical protein
MRNQRWAALAFGLLVAASAWPITLGGGGDAKSVDLSQTFDLAANPASAAASYIVATGKAKNVQKVALASFCVGVVYGKGVTGSSSGGTFSLSKTALAGFPGGVPSGRLQAAADAMYDQFEADLRAAGYEVVPYEQLAAAPSFQKFASKFATAPIEVEEEVDLGKGKSGGNLLVVFSPKNHPFQKDCRLESPSTMSSKVRLSYEKDIAGITLASVKVTMDFAQAIAGGGFLQGAKADMKYGEYFPPGASDNSVQFMNNSGFGTYWLKQAIVAAQNPFKEGGTGAVKRSGDYDAASGRTTTTTEQSTTIDADHELYGANAESHMKALSAMYVAALKGQ